MKAAIFSLLATAAVVTADGAYEPPSTTSTVYSTSVYTITSCAPEYTDCPAKLGSVTTDYISMYTTVCPVSAKGGETAAPYPYPPKETAKPYSTSTYYSTVEYTITACPDYVTNCPVGQKTYSVATSTSVCKPTSTPVYNHEQGGEWTTSTIYSTKEYTITACPAYVTNCPVGKKTAEIYTTTTVCPVSKSTYLPVVATYAAVSQAVSAGVYAPAKSSPYSLSTITYSTCVPSYYTTVVTVYPTSTPAAVQGGYTTYAAVPPPKGTGGSYPASYPGSYPPKSNGTAYVPYTYTGGASAQKAGGLLAAIGLAVVALL